MQFRRFVRSNPTVSALGFGCMRLPTMDQSPLSGNVNEAESIRMIRRAIDGGVNYFDTAYPYHMGNSETVLGKALKDGYRNKVCLATKSPTWLLNSTEDFDKFLGEQLQRLQTDHIDCYLFHGLDLKRWENTVLKLNLLERAESALLDGRIRNLGFSFHDNYAAFEKIVGGYKGWDFCQIQYNYMDTENQAGSQGLKYAASKGLAVVVMEPLLGGRLATPPEPIRAIFDNYPKQSSPVDWALQWLWNQPEVSVVLSGMGTMSQVEANLRSADRSGAHSLAHDDLEMIEGVRLRLREKIPIPCTKCGYCVPCPHDVNIPRNFELYNDGFIYDNVTFPRLAYLRFMPEKERAHACVECRECLDKCPQKIAIPDWLPKVHGVLGEGKDFAAV